MCFNLLLNKQKETLGFKFLQQLTLTLGSTVFISILQYHFALKPDQLYPKFQVIISYCLFFILLWLFLLKQHFKLTLKQEESIESEWAHYYFDRNLKPSGHTGSVYVHFEFNYHSQIFFSCIKYQNLQPIKVHISIECLI